MNIIINKNYLKKLIFNYFFTIFYIFDYNIKYSIYRGKMNFSSYRNYC